MFRAVAITAAMLIAAPAAAAPNGNSGNSSGADALLKGLQAMMSNGNGNGDNPPGRSTRPDDRDQGDDNASDTAIDNVCNKDTPAADRSAICDRSPVSPY